MMSNGGRGRSLERFEESKKRLEPPAWMTQPVGALDYKASTSSSANSRIRYSEHRRSYSAQRSNTASSGLWRSSTSSRGPSPAPGSRPATAGGRFHASHQFSRWSASTLCSDGSNGDNTPTDSVISAFSMRSSALGTPTQPLYPPPPLPRPSSSHIRRPYLGWRSQDSLNENNDDYQRKPSSTHFMSPAERLAYSYRKANASTPGLHQASLATKRQEGIHRACRASYQQTFLHDSIKSVSTAIMEFCNAEDVPQPPPPTPPAVKYAHRRAKDHHRTRIVWLESSFVSAAAATATANGESKSKL